METARCQDYPDQFETERLTLRQWTPGDVDRLYAYASDPRVGLAAGWPPHRSVHESAHIIETVLNVPGTYAVALRDTDEPIGSAGLMARTDIARRPNELELGYWIGVPFWGRGFAGEASIALLNYAFRERGCPRVWCSSFAENTQSQRTQEKLGFRFDHRVDNYYAPLIDQVKTLVVSCVECDEWDTEHEGTLPEPVQNSTKVGCPSHHIGGTVGA